MIEKKMRHIDYPKLWEDEFKYEARRQENKLQGKFRNTTEIKKHLMSCYFPNCVVCHRTNHLELEHKIPVSIGGSVDDLENCQLMCNYCHKGKTNFDTLFISYLKKIGWCLGKNPMWRFYVDKEFIISLYKTLFIQHEKFRRG